MLVWGILSKNRSQSIDFDLTENTTIS